MEDREIIALFNERSENAIAQVRSKYGACCRTIAMNILGSREDAEECVNDMYLKLWNSIPPNCPDNLKAYAVSVVRNRALSRWREKNREKRGGGETELSLEELAELLPDGEGDPAASADAAALGRFIDGFLDRLPEKERLIFCARYYYMYPVTQISKKLGVSKSYVWAVLSRTRGALREALESAGWSV